MDEKNISTIALAKYLYKNKHHENDSKHWENLDSKEKNQRARKIQKWINDTSKPSIDDLQLVCSILDCDFAFLLDEDPIENVNNQKVAEYLGVSENTISAIKNYEGSLKKMIDKLVFANGHGDKMGDILHDILAILLVDCVSASDKEIIIHNKRTGRTEKLSGNKVGEHLLDVFSEHMKQVFYKVSIIALDENIELDKEKEIEKEKQYQEKIEKLKEENLELRKNIDEMIEKNKMQ